MEEWDAYDKDGNLLGYRLTRGQPIAEGVYHRIVHVWIINEFSEFLIQKRAGHLKWFPNRWATTTGSLVSGETYITKGAYREVNEELDLSSNQLDLLFVKDILIGDSIVSIFKGFLAKKDIGLITLNDEVVDVQWMDKTKIETLRKENNFARYSQETFDIVYQFKYEQE